MSVPEEQNKSETQNNKSKKIRYDLAKIRATEPARILLVDDDSDCLEALQQMMEALDHSCTVTEDPRHALEHFLRHSFDLVITDFRMPFMTGRELALKMRAKDPESKIILLSGYHPVKESPDEWPFIAFLEKPIDIHELKRVLSSIDAEKEAKIAETLRCIN